MYNPHLWHGAFLLDPEVKKGLTSEIQGMLARTGSFAYRLTKPVVQKTVHVVQSALSTVGSIAAEPSGLLAALSGSLLHGTFSVGARRRAAGRAATDAGGAVAGRPSGGEAGRAAAGSSAAVGPRMSANGGVAAQIGRHPTADSLALKATLSAQYSLDRAMLLCSAVLEEKLDVLESASSCDRAAAGAAMIAEATAAALAGPNSLGSPRLPPMSSCRETLVQRRRPKPEAAAAEGAGGLSGNDSGGARQQ
jgi:hypothetical protein